MLNTISNLLFFLVMAGFAFAAIFYFTKSSDREERLSYARFAIAFGLFAITDTVLTGYPWLTCVGLVLVVAAAVIRRRADKRRQY